MLPATRTAASTSTDNKVTWQPALGNNTPTVYIDSPALRLDLRQRVRRPSSLIKAHFTDPDNGPWTYTINWDDGTAEQHGDR